MRTKKNGFVQFMKTVDPKKYTLGYEKKKTIWPGSLDIPVFKKLVRRIVEDYREGEQLFFHDRHLLDSAMLWATTEIETELDKLYSGEVLTEKVYKHFCNWYDRLKNGEEPNGREF